MILVARIAARRLLRRSAQSAAAASNITVGIIGRTPASHEVGIPRTGRELQVVPHIALGRSNKEMGLSQSISIETVEKHVQNILPKVPVTDRTLAAVSAMRKG